MDFNEHSRNVFLIISGSALVYKKTAAGRSMKLFHLGKDQAINLEALNKGSPLELRYVAQTPIELMRIQVDLLQRFPDLLNAYTSNWIALAMDACVESTDRYRNKEKLVWWVFSASCIIGFVVVFRDPILSIFV